MIRIQGLGAVYGEVRYDERPPGHAAVDILQHSQRSAPIAHHRCVPFLSLVTNLAVEEEALAAGFSKECRYEIRRAATKDELQSEFIFDPEARLDEFCRSYQTFATQQSLDPPNRRWLSSACDARQLVLSVASQDRAALVWHVYLIVGKTARLHHSISHFRDKSASHRALVGRANRWLHWRDMLQFKEMGFERYDWGGLFEDESVAGRAGINNFKRGFGGRLERTYHCEVPVTMRGRMWLPVRDAWRDLSRLRNGWTGAWRQFATKGNAQRG